MRGRLGVTWFCVCAWLGGLSLAGCARKEPAVLCTCVYGGVEQRLTFPATREPYEVKAVDVAGRFRFKAIYLREPRRAASVNVYAYHQAEDRDVLLQEGKYLPPFTA